jgi:hypothetical protein
VADECALSVRRRDERRRTRQRRLVQTGRRDTERSASDLVTREVAYAYPTDFAAMSAEWIDRLSRRGEQLTRALIAEHAPHLLAPEDQPPRVSSAGIASARREAAAPSVR